MLCNELGSLICVDLLHLFKSDVVVELLRLDGVGDLILVHFFSLLGVSGNGLGEGSLVGRALLGESFLVSFRGKIGSILLGF